MHVAGKLTSLSFWFEKVNKDKLVHSNVSPSVICKLVFGRIGELYHIRPFRMLQ